MPPPWKKKRKGGGEDYAKSLFSTEAECSDEESGEESESEEESEDLDSSYPACASDSAAMGDLPGKQASAAQNAITMQARPPDKDTCLVRFS